MTTDLDRAIDVLLPLDVVLFMEPLAHKADVCKRTRLVGFTRVFEAFRGTMEGQACISLDNEAVEVHAKPWMNKRERFVRKHFHLGSKNDRIGSWGSPWWLNAMPSRRHIALSMWASSPTPEMLLKWINTQDTHVLRAWRSNPCPF